MKNKTVFILLFAILAYFFPLLGNFHLLFSVQIYIFVSFTIILFGTQPPIGIDETNRTRQSDRHSIIAILIACLLSAAFSVIEWAYFREDQQFRFDVFTTIGLLLLFSGTVFRIWSIRTLGRYFTATVQTQTNQKIITTGAYGIIRHPSYLGGFLAGVGSATLLHAYIGIIVSATVMFAAYWYRIRVEEEALVKEFGEEYRSYQKETKKLFPFLY